jgi:hypothetical protein
VRQTFLHKGWEEGPTKRRLDFEMIGREVVVSVEKKAKFNCRNQKIDEETSVASSLGPGVGETQELMQHTNFLDAKKIPGVRQEKEVDPSSNNNDEIGSDDEGKQSTNLLLTTDDDETTVLGLSKRGPKPDDDEGTMTQQLKEDEEVSVGGTCKEAWWTTCKSCNQFPCVWRQYKQAVCENDKVLNDIHMQTTPPPSLVCRQRAFIYIATLVWGNKGYAYRLDLDKCVVKGIREQWPAPNDEYIGNGVE